VEVLGRRDPLAGAAELDLDAALADRPRELAESADDIAPVHVVEDEREAGVALLPGALAELAHDAALERAVRAPGPGAPGVAERRSRESRSARQPSPVLSPAAGAASGSASAVAISPISSPSACVRSSPAVSGGGRRCGAVVALASAARGSAARGSAARGA